MKKFSMLGIIGGATLLAAVPFSLQWSQENVVPAVPLLTLSHASAQYYYGPYRRAYRRAYGGYYGGYYRPYSYGGYYPYSYGGYGVGYGGGYGVGYGRGYGGGYGVGYSGGYGPYGGNYRPY